MKVDILLPIYNSPEETRACIESIIKVTPKENYILYLLDDCSPDPEIKNITNYFSNNYFNVKVYRNEKNKGFPANVNNGFRITTNDVVILNSDTIVTPGWLEGLHRAATSESKVAAVGPLSNYGMITSVPSIYQEVNDGANIERVVEFIRREKIADYPQTPMLVGFCMYIPREALDKIGVLDEETFRKGYGEETDWCLRAREKGYKLLIATDTYVYHVGGTSFGEEKIPLQKRAAKIIKQRYPDYEGEIKRFENNHPLLELRIKMCRNLNVPLKYRLRYSLRRKKRILKDMFQKK
ncbi:glycosyltransferase family 2 protein [Bacillus paranthracis]|uniref:glycosyltransferase family 2 protein n=1 Tax=Bacillus paranthracis TaxID=2026186 RepID=UPI0021CE320D|nr:glycosyltransferase family 2 protein [Bacillus paranthracis]MCU5174419.1 glycosyltransferase family 2 protein [Bacillus paranthracis]